MLSILIVFIFFSLLIYFLGQLLDSAAIKKTALLGKKTAEGRDTFEHTNAKVHFASAKLNTLSTEVIFKVCVCSSEAERRALRRH